MQQPLSPVTAAHTRMRGRKQLIISVIVVTVEQNVWTFWNRSAVLEQLGATVDTVTS